MTKTLTEQWREGTLNGGIYYLLLRDGTTVTDKTVYIVGEKQLRWHYSSFDFVKEVLAPVPSYKDYKKLRKLPLKCFQLEEDNSALVVVNKDMCKEIERLQKKLAIATKALKDMPEMSRAQRALREMEGVK